MAIWDDTSNISVVNLTKAKLKEFTTGTGSDKGEHINSMSVLINIVRTSECQMSDEKC